MPANLTPQYYEAENKFKAAKSTPAKIAALNEMLQIMPKHKGTEHLQADLRTKLARLMEEVESPAKGPSRSTNPFNVRKEGAGQIALVGFTNAGKSALLTAFTGALSKAAPYEYTTQAPAVGMLPYKNIRFQMVDLPAIDTPDVQAPLYGLLRNAGVLALTVDLSADPVKHAREIIEYLGTWGIQVLDKTQRDMEIEDKTTHKKVIMIGTKGDVPGALDGYQALMDAYGNRFDVVLTSAEEAMGAEDMAEAAFNILNIIRVYTKAPGQEAALTTPLVLPRGATIQDVAEDVHKDLLKGLKFAILWGESGKFDAQRVGRDHEVADGDIVELHA